MKPNEENKGNNQSLEKESFIKKHIEKNLDGNSDSLEMSVLDKKETSNIDSKVISNETLKSITDWTEIIKHMESTSSFSTLSINIDTEENDQDSTTTFKNDFESNEISFTRLDTNTKSIEHSDTTDDTKFLTSNPIVQTTDFFSHHPTTTTTEFALTTLNTHFPMDEKQNTNTEISTMYSMTLIPDTTSVLNSSLSSDQLSISSLMTTVYKINSYDKILNVTVKPIEFITTKLNPINLNDKNVTTPSQIVSPIFNDSITTIKPIDQQGADYTIDTKTIIVVSLSVIGLVALGLLLAFLVNMMYSS